MSLVIHPTYFPNILFFSKILNHNKILFEINDNYIKQTLRNRTLIYHANGILNLSIPITLDRIVSVRPKKTEILKP